jgi:hypothetical protein
MKPCEHCKEPFEPKVPKQVYCGATCSARAHARKFVAWRKLNPVASRPQKKHNCTCPKCGETHYKPPPTDWRRYCKACQMDIDTYDIPDIIDAEYRVGGVARMMRASH